MENILACVRIKPVINKETDEKICGKLDEKSIIMFKTNEKYNFGTDVKNLFNIRRICS